MADIRRVHRTSKSSINDQDSYNFNSSTKFLDSNENLTTKKKKSSANLTSDSPPVSVSRKSTKKVESTVTTNKTSRINDLSNSKSNTKNESSKELSSVKQRSGASSKKSSHISRSMKQRASFSKSPASRSSRSMSGASVSKSRSRSKSLSDVSKRSRSRNRNDDDKQRDKSKSKKQLVLAQKSSNSKLRNSSPHSYKSPKSFRDRSPSNISVNSDNSINAEHKPYKSSKSSSGVKEGKSKNKDKEKDKDAKIVKKKSSDASKTKSSSTKDSKEKEKISSSSKKKSSSKKISKSRSKSPNSDYKGYKNYENDDFYSNRSKSRSRSRSRNSSASLHENEYPPYGGRNKMLYGSGRRSPQSTSLSKKGSSSKQPPYNSKSQFQGRNTFSHDIDMGNEEYPEYPYNSRYREPPPFGRGRFIPGGPGGHPIPPEPYGMGSNRNQFYPPGNSGYYGNPKYMPNPKFNKNYNKYYQHSGGVPPPLPPHLDDQDSSLPPSSYPGGAGTYGQPAPHMHHNRFNPNYHYMNSQYHHQYHPNNPHFNNMNNQIFNKQQYMNKSESKQAGKGVEGEKNKTGSDVSDAEAATSGNEAAATTSDIEIDSELTSAVAEITAAIAAASASGKELTLTQEQQLILQKHQLLVQQQQQLKQQKAQQLQLNQMQLQANQAQNLKKFPNYRLLGRNIFDAGTKQPFFKKKINKANTYYSRYIKQHPTMNLPLAFQKSVGLAEDKAMEETEKQQIKQTESVFANSLLEEALNMKKERKKLLKKIKKKTKKRENNSDSDSDSSSSSASSKSTSKSTKSSGSNNSSTSGEIKTTRKSKGHHEKNAGEILENQSRSSRSSSSTSSSSSSHKKTSKSTSKKSINGGLGTKSNVGNDSDSDGSMLDLRENLKPIGAYIKDRERMLDEMLRCIKGKKLEAMLPDMLKNRTFKEIRRRCLEVLDIMSKKRIGCLLADKPMMSSSGTDESTTDEEIDIKEKVKDNTSNVEKSNKSSKIINEEVSKFKPIGADSHLANGSAVAQQQKSIEPSVAQVKPKAVNENKELARVSFRPEEQDELVEASETNKDEEMVSESQTGPSSTQSGVAAAGFKKFIKKSISIRIKQNDQVSTDFELKQQQQQQQQQLQQTTQEVTNKLLDNRSQLINKQNIQEVNSELKSLIELDNRGMPLHTIPAHLQHTQQPHHQHHSHHQQHQISSHLQHHQQQQFNNFQRAPIYHQNYQQQQQSQIQAHTTNMPPGFHIPPPGHPASFAYPPPPIIDTRMIAPQQLQQQLHQHQLKNPHLAGPPPTHHIPGQTNFNPYVAPPGVLNQHMNPPINHSHAGYSQNVSPYYPPHVNANMNSTNMNVNGHNNNHKMGDDDYESFNVNNDDAYDLDDNNEILNDYDSNNIGRSHNNKRYNKSKSKYSPNDEYDDNYDLELDLDNLNEIINIETKSKKKSKKGKKEKSRHHHRHRDNDEDEEDDDEQLAKIRNIIINVLEMHLNNFEAENEMGDQSEDPTIVMLQMLLQQINEDDGSLSLEDYYGIHEQIKNLLDRDGNTDASDDEYENLKKDKKKKKRSNPLKEDINEIVDHSEDELRSPKKKRKNVNSKFINDNSTNSKKSFSRNSKYENENRMGEVEAGEIDDIYDDDVSNVEKEFEDLIA